MKKTLIAVTAVLLLVTTSAFADITMGTWLRTVFAPVASDGDANYTDMGNSWGGMRQSSINVAGTAADDLAGFKADFYINNGSVGMGDNAYIWVKPIDMIKLAYGKYDSPEAGFRGDLCYGSWDWLRASFVGYDEGLTFSGNGGEGAMVILNPIENLTIYGLIPTSGKASYETKSFMAYGNSEIAAAYTIDGIGKIKAGYFGKYIKSDDYEILGDLEVAFDLTAVDGLYVTAGFQYRLGDDEALAYGSDPNAKREYTIDYENGKFKEPDAFKKAYGHNMKIALGASYQIMDGFKISASGQVFLYPDYSDFESQSDYKDRQPAFDAGVGIDYAIMDGLTLVADVRYHSETAKDAEDDGISFLVGLDKTVGSNGSIGVGFQGVTNGRGFFGGESNVLNNSDKFAWAVPLKVQVSL